VELKYSKINLTKELSSKNTAIDLQQEEINRIQNKFLALQDAITKARALGEVERTENKNLRKAMEELTKKNQTLRDKLRALGARKVPQSDMEKRVFFTDVDK
jgi:hypothetical protein